MWKVIQGVGVLYLQRQRQSVPVPVPVCREVASCQHLKDTITLYQGFCNATVTEAMK